jgi:hypothetical protein
MQKKEYKDETAGETAPENKSGRSRAGYSYGIQNNHHELMKIPSFI